MHSCNLIQSCVFKAAGIQHLTLTKHAHMYEYQCWEKSNGVPVGYKQKSDLTRGFSLQEESPGQIVFQVVAATS